MAKIIRKGDPYKQVIIPGSPVNPLRNPQEEFLLLRIEQNLDQWKEFVHFLYVSKNIGLIQEIVKTEGEFFKIEFTPTPLPNDKWMIKYFRGYGFETTNFSSVFVTGREEEATEFLVDVIEYARAMDDDRYKAYVTRKIQLHLKDRAAGQAGSSKLIVTP